MQYIIHPFLPVVGIGALRFSFPWPHDVSLVLGSMAATWCITMVASSSSYRAPTHCCCCRCFPTPQPLTRVRATVTVVLNVHSSQAQAATRREPNSGVCWENNRLKGFSNSTASQISDTLLGTMGEMGLNVFASFFGQKRKQN